MAKLIFVDTPYGHPDPMVRALRYRQAVDICAVLIQRGYMTFSPIVHNHPITERAIWGDLSTQQRRRAMEDFNSEMVTRCDEVFFIHLDGWNASFMSDKIRAEVEQLGKPYREVKLEDLTTI